MVECSYQSTLQHLVAHVSKLQGTMTNAEDNHRNESGGNCEPESEVRIPARDMEVLTCHIDLDITACPCMTCVDHEGSSSVDFHGGESLSTGRDSTGVDDLQGVGRAWNTGENK